MYQFWEAHSSQIAYSFLKSTLAPPNIWFFNDVLGAIFLFFRGSSYFPPKKSSFKNKNEELFPQIRLSGF